MFPNAYTKNPNDHRCAERHRRWAVAIAAVMLAFAAMIPGSTAADEGKDAFAGAEKNASVAAQEHKDKTKGFNVRAQPWRGVLGKEKGKAVRIQLFKGNTYRFFIAVSRDVAAKGVAPVAQVVDAEFNRLAESGKPKDGVTVLEISPAATGMYMILIRADSSEKSPDEFAAAMIYGFE